MRLANAFHMALGLALAATGVWVLLLAGNTLKAEGPSMVMLRELATALVLLGFGFGHVRTSVANWSFRFTIDTISAGPFPAQDKDAKTKTLAYLDDLIEKGMRPPPGTDTAVGGLVEAIAPHLGMAQAAVKVHAFRQIQRSIYLFVLLCSFLVAWFIADASVFPLVAAIYFFLAFSITVRGVLKHQDSPPEQAISGQVPLPTPRKAIVLLVMAVIVPAALSYVANQATLPPQLAGLQGFALPTLVILLPALAGSLLFFVALARQTAGLATSTGSGWGVDRDYEIPDLTDGLLIHLEGEVPEPRTRLRRYFSCSEDKWTGGFLYETAPELVRGQDVRTLAGALRSSFGNPMSRPLVWLDLLGLVLGLAACVFALRYAAAGGMALAAMAAGLLAASQYCMGAAHKLWKRADFRSAVYEVRAWSNIQRETGTRGNEWTGGGKDQVHSHTVLAGGIQVRVLTLRSVQFTPGGPRHATSIDLDVARSEALAEAALPYAQEVLRRKAEAQARRQQEHAAYTPAMKHDQIGPGMALPARGKPLLEGES